MNSVSPHTRFYRDPPQLDALAAALAGRAHPRVLSAGCSTGEEAYTVAMMLGDCEVVGVDIDANNIAIARRATYPEAELPPRLRRYLREGVVDAAIVQRCRFRAADLLTTALFGPFDAVLCRNVIIYLAEHDALALLDRLARALAADGILLVARAEILLARRVESLEAFTLAEDVVAFRRSPRS
jgi:chemotaxis protein methyltransferase CheR